MNSNNNDLIYGRAAPPLTAAHIGFVFRATGRLLIALILFAVAIKLGVAIPYHGRTWIASLPPAGLAFGAAAILTVLKELFDSLPKLWDFVVDSDVKSLPRMFSQVAVAAMGLGFAYYATQDITSAPKTLNLSFGGSPPPMFVNESDALFTAYVLFGEKESTLKGTYDLQTTLVNNLVDSLAACLQSASDRIDLVVRAYASSSGPDSDNRLLYKDREMLVAKMITDRAAAQGKAAQFKVEVRDWQSLDVMKVRRLFKDTDAHDTYSLSAGALNRRAEIRVHSAGSCLSG